MAIHLLDNLEYIRRIDRADMLGKIRSLSRQCREGLSGGLRWRVPSQWRDLRHLVILGMGGSAIGGDLLQGLFGDQMSRPIRVLRTYTLPSWVNRQTLVIASSYSGNTEETLSACREAAQRRAPIAVISSGGLLTALAFRKGFPLFKVPEGWPPRAALGFMTFVPLGFLSRLGWVKPSDASLEEAFDSLERFMVKALSPSVELASNPAKKIAMRLLGHLPVVYGASGKWEAVAYRWRSQLEENAKTLAFHHLFPEMTHNEISGWGRPASLTRQVVALFLTDSSLHPRVRRRMEFVGRLIEKEGVERLTVETSGLSLLSRALKLVALGDFVSTYLGLLYKVDPTPVERVEALKRYMKH